MVVVEKNGNADAVERSNGARPGSASTSNGHRSDESPGSSSDEEHEPGMRIGAEYQAVIPDVVETSGPMKTDSRPEALLVWAPCMDVSEVKLDEYIHVAKEKYGYNTEQALGMLFWHKYNVAKSLADLPNFTPFPSEWTVEDKVLFEQAFSFHGKSFHRIRQMLPDKSISTLVRYYYQWKKTRTRTSLMDRHVRKLALAQKENEEDESGENSNDSDFDPEKEAQKGDGTKGGCSNCAATVSQLHTTPKGQLCNQCYSYWRRTGVMRVHIGPVRSESHSLRHHPVRTRKRPPKGMYISAEDLMVMTNAAQSEVIFKELDTEMTNKKREVQYNKQLLSQQRNSMNDKFEEYRPQVAPPRNNVRWTNDELLLAVQAVRKYGKDFQAIADVVGNKNVQQCSSFLINYRRRFNLDQVLEEYECDQAASNDNKNSEISEKQLPLPSQVTGVVANIPPPLLRPTSQPPPKTTIPAQARFLQPPRSSLQQLPPPLIRPASHPQVNQHRAHPSITGPLSRPPQLLGNQNLHETPMS